jgi:primosomal protein N' (replication factor Y)
MSVLRLAIPSPLRQLFDYLPPAGMAPEAARALEPGVRLRVPFGPRELTGILVKVLDEPEPGGPKLKQALAVLEEKSLLNFSTLALCRWATSYYHHPPGEVYTCAFPNRLRRGGTRVRAGEPGWRLTTRGLGLPDKALGRAPRQAQAIALLREAAEVTADSLSREGISPAILRGLEQKGLIERCRIAAISPTQPGSGPGLQLNPEQAAVTSALLQARNSFSAHLLEGVTGSGKTEVYLQLIADCLQRGRQALVLIPEIGLTPQTLERFRQRFDANIAVFHSGLSEGDRCRAWEAARDGSAHIVIGTRSAVYTPLLQTGLIVVDEEHDSAYKQQDGFRYSARDVAVKRAQLESCPVLLGSATPSLESLHNALSGRYRLHRLTARAGGASLPTVQALDVRGQDLQAGLSGSLLESIDATLSAGGQVLLFLNRRGYAPTLRCHDCGWVAQCDHCDARLTLHRNQRRVRCHHCGAARPQPGTCPACHSDRLLTAGLGTEQAEGLLRQHFPDWPLHRVDSDSMTGRDAMHQLVNEINRGLPCILLGTQMLTKGHHFPCVSLVAVIDADALLFSADFRGEERMAQLLTQVSGRAGRAGIPGKVLLQTHYPDHPTLQSLLQLSYHDLARGLLQQRQDSGLPPVGQLVLLRTDCADADSGEDFLSALRRALEGQLPPACTFIGPLPAPMQRRAGKFRSHLLLATPDRRTAQGAAAMLVREASGLPARRGLKWTIDVDPQDMF